MIGWIERGLFALGKTWVIAAVVVTLVFAAASAWLNVRIDPAAHADTAHREALADLRRARWVEAEIAVLVSFPQTTVWTEEALVLLARLQETVAQVPGVDPDSIASLLTPLPVLGPGTEGEADEAALTELEALVRPPIVEDGSATAGPLRTRWAEKDIGWLSRLSDLLGLKGRFVSVNGRALVMRVLMAPPKPDGPSYGDVMRGLSRAVEQAVHGVPAKITFAGFPMRMGSFDLSLERGWPLLLLISAMAMAGFWYVARSIPAAVAALAVAFVPILWICGGMALLGRSFDPLAWPAMMGVFAIGILGGGVALALYTARLSWGEDQHSAARGLMRQGLRVLAPAALAGLVALVPLSLLPGTAARDLVVLGGVGVVLGIGAMVTLLPVVLSLLPTRPDWLDTVSRMVDLQRRGVASLRPVWAAPGLRTGGAAAAVILALLVAGVLRPAPSVGVMTASGIGVPSASPPDLAAFGLVENSLALHVDGAGLSDGGRCDPRAARLAAAEVLDSVDLGRRFGRVAPERGALTTVSDKLAARSDVVLNARLSARAEQTFGERCDPIHLIAGDVRSDQNPVQVVAAVARDLASGPQGSAARPGGDGSLSIAVDAGTLAAQAAIDRAADAREPLILAAMLAAAALMAGLGQLRIGVGLAVLGTLAAGMALSLGVLALAGIGAGTASLTALAVGSAVGATGAALLASLWADARREGHAPEDVAMVVWERGGRALLPLGLLAALILAASGVLLGGLNLTIGAVAGLAVLVQTGATLLIVPKLMAAGDRLPALKFRS